MKQLIQFILTLLVFTSTINAQSLKQKTADKLYNNMAYTDAYPFYKELASSKKTSYDLVKRAAVCAYNVMDYVNAENYFKKLNFKNLFLRLQR